MVRYRHPKHGYHLLGYGDDVAAFRAAGWVPDEPAPPAPDPEPVPVAASEPPPPAEPAPVIATPPTIRRGPGRPRKVS